MFVTVLPDAVVPHKEIMNSVSKITSGCSFEYIVMLNKSPSLKSLVMTSELIWRPLDPISLTVMLQIDSGMLSGEPHEFTSHDL